jgi:cell division protein FtsI/penicillin-binding protein 2
MEVRIRIRILWLSVVVLLILSALGGRLAYVQVYKSTEYSRIAYSQRTLSLPVAGSRGQILDRHGALLTDATPGWRVAVFPPLVKDRTQESQALARVLQIPEGVVWNALDPKGHPLWLDPVLTQAQAASVRTLQLPGVAVGVSAGRYGPDPLARHLVGYLNEQGGQLGLERVYDKALAGTAAPALVAQVNALGDSLDGLGIHVVQPGAGKPPADVHTTLDAQIQMEVERVLDHPPQGDPRTLRAAVVVMDPSSGDVLAMASRPQFDYGGLGRALARADAPLMNRAVAAYEPGSVFKPFEAALALEKGLVQPDEEFFCNGHFTLGDHQFGEPGDGHGHLTFAEAVAESCNVTFMAVGYDRLGPDGIREAARRFGLGTRTDVLGPDWTEEQAGLVPEGGDAAAQMAIGQGGLMVTPLQIARAYCAIANGGTLPPVRLVTAVKSPTGEVLDRPAAGRGKRIISSQVAGELQQMLAAVTDPNGEGTGRAAWIPGVGSAGKTGSAETGRAVNGRAVVHAWFAGYFPVKQPRYVVAVLVEDGQYGGVAAAPIFKAIGEALVKDGL